MYVCIALTFAIGLTVIAQEATEPPEPPPTLTETPLPTLTPTFTETATLLPSETATSVLTATETATLPVVETPTVETTAEVTIEPAPETTVELTAVVESTSTPLPLLPEPPLVAVVSEAFAAPHAPGWQIGSGWQIHPHEANYALQAVNPVETVSYIETTYMDSAVELLLQMQHASFELSLRGQYRLHLSSDGQVMLYRDMQVLGEVVIPTFMPDQWRHIRFSAIGDTLRVAIDGLEVLAVRDLALISIAGYITFHATFPEQADTVGQTLLVDNIRFWIPENLEIESEETATHPAITAIPILSSDTTHQPATNLTTTLDTCETFDFTTAEAEVLVVPSSNTTTHSQLITDPNRRYIVRISGVIIYTILAGKYADALYINQAGSWIRYNWGVTVDGTQFDDDDTIVNSDHTYTKIIQGTNSALAFHLVDSYYADNSGNFSVSIWDCGPALPSTPTPTPSPTPTSTATLTETATPTATESMCTGTVNTSGSGLNLRDIPDGNVLASIPSGEILDLLGISGDGKWLYTVFNAIYGWVWKNYVTYSCQLPVVNNAGYTATPTPTLSPTPTLNAANCIGVSVEGTDVNVRSRPIDGDILYTISNSTYHNVQILARYTQGTQNTLWDDWYKVRNSEGEIGWASAEFIASHPLYGTPCSSDLPYYDQYLEDGTPIPFYHPSERTAPSDMIQQAIDLFSPSIMDTLRLPEPFSYLPMADGETLHWTQGYGMNEFAYRHVAYYDETNHIHSGLDFGGLSAGSADECLADNNGQKTRCIRIQIVCDGVIVNHRPSAGSSTGAGFTLRCYAADGSLSNIYMVYNHLTDNLPPLNARLVTGTDLETRAIQYGTNATPHLHLEAFILSGREIRLNPILLFDIDSFSRFYYGTGDYYPYANFSEIPSNVLLFEWPPVDKIDPDPTPVFSDWTNYPGYTQGQSRQTSFQDMDLGISPGDFTPFIPVADTVPVSPVTPIPWRRTDHINPNGIQDIDIPGPEWLGDYFIFTVSDLINRLTIPR
jgi:hypothetical protein